MTEPEYIRQVHQDPSLHRAWFEECGAEAKAEGCTFGRYSTHPDDEQLALVEGWTQRPNDQGEIRWQLTR
ncbi:hypothetical protein EVC10_069 [Rhizobium phage RHph_Y25]|nr:hypothetical protein EVC10_069 [Rhizobium phage RHph_Y25]